MRREHTFPLRLGDAERDDLEQRAAEQGIAKADVIRKAMGWQEVGLIAPPDSEPLAPALRPAPAGADREDGPGDRGMAELARRLQARKGQ